MIILLLNGPANTKEVAPKRSKATNQRLMAIFVIKNIYQITASAASQRSRGSKSAGGPGCRKQAGAKDGFRRRSTHGESLANETEPFSDAVTLHRCVMRSDNFENYTAGPFPRTCLWVAPRWLWPPGVPSRSCIFPFV